MLPTDLSELSADELVQAWTEHIRSLERTNVITENLQRKLTKLIHKRGFGNNDYQLKTGNITRIHLFTLMRLFNVPLGERLHICGIHPGHIMHPEKREYFAQKANVNIDDYEAIANFVLIDMLSPWEKRELEELQQESK